MPLPSVPRPRLRAATLVVALASAVLLAAALWLPTVRFQRMGKEPEVYSILGGVRSLWEDGNRVSAAIVFLFSVVFPLGKLAYLAAVAGRGRVPRRGAPVLRALIALGKWSMIDVFVIALFVGAIQPGMLADASTRSGIHLFMLGVLLSMVAARLTARAVGVESEVVQAVARPGRWPAALSLASLGLFAAGAVHAFYLVKESFFSKNEIALDAMVGALWGEGERIVAASLLVFVLASTGLRALAAVAERLAPRRALARATLWLDEWAMLDVFCLGLWMVWDKLVDLTDTTLLAGFWLLLAAALAGDLDVWLLRRRVRRGA